MTNSGVARGVVFQDDDLAKGYKDAQSDFATVFPYGIVADVLIYTTYVIHGGMLEGFRTEIRRYTNDKVTIIQLCNHEAVALYPIAEEIAAKLFGK
jgi:hypothetical protein